MTYINELAGIRASFVEEKGALCCPLNCFAMFAKMQHKMKISIKNLNKYFIILKIRQKAAKQKVILPGYSMILM